MLSAVWRGKIWRMWRKIVRGIVRLTTSLLLLAGLALLLPRLITALYAGPRLVSVQDAPERAVAIVFGAGLQRDGTPTAVLRDRVAAAAELYFSGKVKKILMSGDNRFVEYNEPGAMAAYAIRLGVPRSGYRPGLRRAAYLRYLLPGAAYLRHPGSLAGHPALPPAPRPLFVQLPGRAGSGSRRRPAHLPPPLAADLAFTRNPGDPGCPVGNPISHPVPVLGDPEPIFPLEAQ